MYLSYIAPCDTQVIVEIENKIVDKNMFGANGFWFMWNSYEGIRNLLP